MPQIGVPELLILLLIVVFVFGLGRLPDVGGAMGKGIREFRQAVSGPEEPKKPVEALQQHEAKSG